MISYYDSHGIYGHPDHVQVHRVGQRAAELTGTPASQVTASREHYRAAFSRAVVAGMTLPGGLSLADVDRFGVPERQITTRVDVSAYARRKRAALLAHASQATDIGFVASLDDELFEAFFGTEFFIREPDGPPGLIEELAGPAG